MEGTSEESDQLNGVTHLKARGLRQPQQKSYWGTFFKGCVSVLLVCAALLIVADVVREQTILQCQLQHLQTARDNSSSIDPKNEEQLQEQGNAVNKQQVVEVKPQKPSPFMIQEPQTASIPTIEQQPQPIEQSRPLPPYNSQLPGQQSLNLWEMPLQYKIGLFSKMGPKQNSSSLAFTPSLGGKDEQVKQFFQEYQSKSEVLNWSSLKITKDMDTKLKAQISSALRQRGNTLNELIEAYTTKYSGKSGYMPDQNKGITYQQFLQTLQLKKLTGSTIFPQNSRQLQQIELSQRQHYQRKYHISQYEELPVCIVMPTYKNMQDLRYAWSIESLLQQDYTNYRVIIIDDDSSDGTAEATATYLKWRSADPARYTLIKKRERLTALGNIYYAAHKYCDYNQIFMIFDGDDELFGRQALKVLNAHYQQHKYYLLYSQFISFNPANRRERLEIGISQDFPSFVKQRNAYRTFKHSYSQLRTVISDLILLEPVSSLKLKNGNFFALLYDNALFYPAFEMSCGNFAYLPEIFYFYNINTGANDWKKAKTQLYKDNRFGIELQKPFRCIEQQLRQARDI